MFRGWLMLIDVGMFFLVVQAPGKKDLQKLANKINLWGMLQVDDRLLNWADNRNQQLTLLWPGFLVLS